ncbi:MAG: hydrogenase expression/formation protein HypE [Verrucomicrobia bacterium]|nr:MAG: hydrogenase expression/formation protein HypE [Verrucomicrobiota bacterium]
MPSDEIILMSHGGGGRRTQQLLRDHVLPPLDNPILRQMDDAACLELAGVQLAFTTDSYVIRPLFFPGGDIGRLAVCGTVNDLAMQGAQPLYLTLGLILEEGLRVNDLDTIMQSAAAAAREAGVQIVAGDTKVVERGAGSGLFINTAGLGLRRSGVDTHIANARPGDVILITGTLGDHGVAVLSRREGLAFQTELVSDVAPLNGLTAALLDAVPGVHALRDPTRGGLAAALNDVAAAAHVGIRIEEKALPVRPDVRGACGLLGLEPLSVANEGKALVICAAADEERALAALRAHPLGHDACRIGAVLAAPAGKVLLHTRIGGERLVEMPLGDDLPRIC